MVQGFFDDSGKESDPSNKIVCIAGYVAAPGMWNGFQEMWRHMLVKHNLKWLHMKDFLNDKSSEYAYLGLDWPRKQRILEDFASAIKINQLIGFGISVDAEAWQRMPKETIKAQGTVQEFCFIRILRTLVERIKRSAPEEHVSITFDCDRAYTPARFQRYIAVRDKFPDAERYLAAFNIAEPKVYVPLQAADLLAWETRKDLLRQIEGHQPRPEFDYMMKIMPGFFPDYSAELWTEKALEEEFGPLSPIVKAI
jgi:hypothetical protein